MCLALDFGSSNRNACYHYCDRIRSRLIFPYRKLYLTDYWSVRDHNKQILWKINSALYSKQLGEQSCSSVLHWILDQATELHATIMSQNSIQVDFPVQGNCTWQFTDQFVAEHSCSSVLHWILDEATEMHATIMSENSIQVDFPVQGNCTWQFTDQFVIITEGFRALSKLDLESLYLTSPKLWNWT